MNENEQIIMSKYGITCVKKNIYHYKEYRYERLEDAVAYAKKNIVDETLITENSGQINNKQEHKNKEKV